MAWIGIITNNGNDLLTRWVEGKTLTVTRAAAGQGRVDPAAMLAQAALVNEKQTASIISNTPVDKGQRMKLQVTPQSEAGYSLNQFGVWARLEGEDEKMIALFQTDTDIGVEIPSKADMPDFVYTFYGLLAFSNQGSLTVNVDAAAVVTAETLGQAVAAVVGEHEADEGAHAALFAKKADLSESGKMDADQLPVGTAGGVAGLDDNGKVPVKQLPVGSPHGLAELDEAGKVPASQLPGYVDDVVEGYYHEGAFYTDLGHQSQITPESGKIYVDVETNITYRWSGTVYVAIGSDLALGETSSTAYRGDRGKAAYDHSQITEGNPHGTKAHDIGYTDNKGLGSTNLQGAMDAAAQAAADAQRAADDALDAITALAHTIDAIPSQSGSLTYTGSPQSPSWNSYNPETLTLGGQTSGTNAGEYQATFTPKEGYTWSGGGNEAKTVTWRIGRASISAVPTQSGSLIYTGSAQSPTWNGYDTDKLTIGGEQSATDAGSHTATFTPTANYQWNDGGTGAKEAVWSIGRATISTVPSQTGTLTYTGSAQSPQWANYDSGKMTLGGTTQGTNAGTYQATFTPTSNYCWSGGSTAAKNVSWSIGKAAGSLTLNPTSMTLTNATKTGTIVVTRAGDGAITATSNNTGIATVSVSGTNITVTGVAYGTATITVKVAAGTNHNAPADKTCTVKVNVFSTTLNSNTWAAIKAASDAGNAASVWSVGDTKNIKINGKVGNFTFSNLSIDAFIVGFNHNSAKEGANRIHFALGKIGGKLVALCDSQYSTEQTNTGYFNMNTSRTNARGWSGCYMRTTLLGNSGSPSSPPANSLLAALPSDLRAVMKSVTKYTDNHGNSNATGDVTATTDWLWLFAEFEVQGSRSYANQYEQNSQKQYDYWKSGNSKVAYRHSSTGTAVWWWRRSPRCNRNVSFCDTYTDGSSYSSYASWSAGVVAGFAA